MGNGREEVENKGVVKCDAVSNTCQFKKENTVVSQRKERASVVYERKSPKGQKQAGRGRVLRKGERRSSQKGQKSAESRVLRLLSAVGATGVPVTRALEHHRQWMWG